MSFNKEHNKALLETKIKALDLLQDGWPIMEISKLIKFPKNTVLYWKYMESTIRRVYELNNDIERLKATILGPSDAPKYIQIIDRLVMIEELYKHKQVALKDKIRCLDLLPLMEYDVSKVTEMTGYSLMNIHSWRKNEDKLRNLANNEIKPINTVDETIYRNGVCKRTKSDELRVKRKYPWVSEIKRIIDLKPPTKKRKKETNKSIVYDQKAIDYCVDDKEIQMLLNTQHSNNSLNTKIEALNMYDSGITISKISLNKNVTKDMVKYWISLSSELRNQALEIQRLKDLEYLKVSGGGSVDDCDFEQTIATQKERVRRSCTPNIFPTELKLKIVDYLHNSSLNPASVGDIFGCSRHLIGYMARIRNKLSERLAARDELRSKRLLTLLTSCNHNVEVIKLNKLCKCPDLLVFLGGYLTYGTTSTKNPFIGIMGARTQRKEVTPVKKVTSEMEIMEQKREQLVANSMTSSMVHFYQELYCQEYRLLADVERRYILLSGQDRSDNASSLLTQLQDHTLASFTRMIILHQSMLGR